MNSALKMPRKIKMDNPIRVQKDEATKIRAPQRWTQKDEGPKRADFGT